MNDHSREKDIVASYARTRLSGPFSEARNAFPERYRTSHSYPPPCLHILTEENRNCRTCATLSANLVTPNPDFTPRVATPMCKMRMHFLDRKSDRLFSLTVNRNNNRVYLHTIRHMCNTNYFTRLSLYLSYYTYIAIWEHIYVRINICTICFNIWRLICLATLHFRVTSLSFLIT